VQAAWQVQERRVSRRPEPAAQPLEPQATPQRALKPWLPEQQRASPLPLVEQPTRQASVARLWLLLL
jgi:hypothetical protein